MNEKQPFLKLSYYYIFFVINHFASTRKEHDLSLLDSIVWFHGSWLILHILHIAGIPELEVGVKH